MSDEKQEAIVVFTGKRGAVYNFRQLDGCALRNVNIAFSKINKRLYVGGVYKVKALLNEEGGVESIYPKSLEYQSIFGDKTLVEQWRLEQAIEDESVQIEKEEKRFRNLLDVTDSIEEMVTMYRKLRSYKERDTFKRMLIRSFESKAARQED